MLTELQHKLLAAKRALELVYQLPMGSYRVKHLKRVMGLTRAIRTSIIQLKVSIQLKEVSNYA